MQNLLARFLSRTARVLVGLQNCATCDSHSATIEGSGKGSQVRLSGLFWKLKIYESQFAPANFGEGGKSAKQAIPDNQTK